MSHIRTLLLLALPASGKSEIRRLLAHLTPEQREVLHLGKHLVQIDDYPYVEFMRETDRIMTDVFHFDPIFFRGPDRRFQDPSEWLTLIELLNQDYQRLRYPPLVEADDHGLAMLQRIIKAQHYVSTTISELQRLPTDVLKLLGKHLTVMAANIYTKIFTQHLTDDATLIVEFARGGAHDALMPLHQPMGYAISLSHLTRGILEHAGILYVQVAPEQARAKNFERAVPPPGQEHDTTIYHGVPLCVMLKDYGCDDFLWLAHVPQNAEPNDVRRLVKPICVDADGDGGDILVPTAVFDNRHDLTTPLRAEPPKWSVDDFNNAYRPLKDALDLLHAGLLARVVKS